MGYVNTTPTGSTKGSQVSVTGAANAHSALADADTDSYVVIPRVDLWDPGKGSAKDKKYDLSALTLTLTFPQPSPVDGSVLKGVQFLVDGKVEGTDKPKTRTIELTRENHKPIKKDLSFGQTHDSANPRTTAALEKLGAPYDYPKVVIRGDSYSNIDKTSDRGVILYDFVYRYLYVEQPVATVTAPLTGTTLSSASAPVVAWNMRGDDEVSGGNQTHFQVRIYGSSSFTALDALTNPNSATSGVDSITALNTSNSGVQDGGGNTFDTGINLTNGSYRVYVRTAQTVNGAKHWSDWTYSAFDVSVTRPGVPTSFSATADNANARITLSAAKVASGSGVAVTNYLQFQRSTDGGTSWTDIRTANGGGRVTASSSTTTAYDYEVGNGQSAIYRVRAVQDYVQSEGDNASAWSSSSSSVSWTSTSWYLKAPTRPSLNMPVLLESLPEENRQARQGAFQAVGASKPIIVSDTRGSKAGSISFLVDSDEEKEALDALIELAEPLLLQGVDGHHWTDKYVALGDYARKRAPDKAWVEASIDSTSWVEVDEPSSDLAE